MGYSNNPKASDRPPACASLSSSWSWKSNKLRSCMVRQVAGCNSVSTVTRSPYSTSYNTTWSKRKTKPHHLWQWWPDWLMILPSFHNLLYEGCQWRPWIPIMMFDDFVSTTRSFATRHQHGMENDKKWCEMTRIFQSYLGTVLQHLSDKAQRTAMCLGKLCPKLSVSPTQKPTVAPPSPKAKCFAPATAVLNFSLV